MNLKNFWLLLAVYGVWFAIFSGLEEVSNGKYWKFILSVILGLAVYLLVEKKVNRNS